MSDESSRPVAVTVSACDFPHGLAAPYRIRMFARSFAVAGFRPVCVFQYSPGVATAGQNTQLKGSYEGIEFVYPIGTLVPPRSFWRMLYYKTWGLACSLLYLQALHRKSRVAVVFSYGNTWLEDWFYQRAASRLGARFIVEICDSPQVVLNRGARGLRRAKELLKLRCAILRDRWILPRADAVFVISHYLHREYAKRIDPHRILLTPVLGDRDAFLPAPRVPGSILRLVWIGNFRPFEGLEFLIRSMALLKGRGTLFACEIYGATPKHAAYAASLQTLIESCGLSDLVRLHAAVRHSEVPTLLRHADLLLIPREDSELNRSNLPTKLVDYLLSGRPVLSSRVGEILAYAVDRRDIIYPAAETEEAFVDALQWVATHRNEAEKIGAAGRRMAEQKFDFRLTGENIRRFLAGLGRTVPPAHSI